MTGHERVARLDAEVERLTARQRVLADLGRAISDGPLEERLALAAARLAPVVEARRWLVLQRRGDGRFVVRAGTRGDGVHGQVLPADLTPALDGRGRGPAVVPVAEHLGVATTRTLAPSLRVAERFLVLPVADASGCFAIALVDPPPRHQDADTLEFLDSVGSLLGEAQRRTQAECELRERVKELTALATLGRLVQRQMPTDELLQAAATALSNGMQFPHRAVARIAVDSTIAVSDGGRPGLAEELRAPILADGAHRGHVAVGHRTIEGFLADYEQQLVDAAAEVLSLWVERNETMARTRESEARLRSVLEQVPGVVWAVDMAMRITGHAGRGHVAIDLEPDTHRGRSLIDLLGADHPAVAAVHEALSGRAATYEGRLLGRWFETRIEPLYNADDEIVGAIAMAVDTTESRRTQQALRRSEERFRRLAENAQDVIYRLEVTDPPSFSYVSQAVEDLLGVDVEEVHADPGLPLTLLATEDRDRIVRCVLEPRDAPAPFVAPLKRPDGRVIWVEERHAYVLDEDGRHVATEGVVRDITARKQVEQELRDGLLREQAAADDLRTISEMKDAFLTAVSHELRTPLTALKGLSQLLHVRDEQLGGDQRRDLLERLSSNADRLEQLFDDLLDIDRLARGAGLLDRQPVDLALLVERTVDRLPTNGHPVTLEVEPAPVVVDTAKVERVVENLVVNAIRHTEGPVEVWVRVANGSDGATLTVEDAGPGVPASLREQIFEPFDLGNSAAAKVGGMGVGLTLVRRFVELHNGTVDVTDREGGGAAFRVWLPHGPARGDGATDTTWAPAAPDADPA